METVELLSMECMCTMFWYQLTNGREHGNLEKGGGCNFL